ncbi:DUF1285 domain-containing protein [Shewanella sp. SR44-3]|uniref:DUF1285 domain-containing protein n=1 Tax=unclassified Shewanella TaxID=196818 RepID=UPI0015FA4073|nr:DUF1285 domain-containing protein [Shewanella sp. SR44-3]MBB1270384.1 DUF1285 domain-containing protein [Shewanella sp. SR44-3]
MTGPKSANAPDNSPLISNQGEQALRQFLPENVPLCDDITKAPLFDIDAEGNWLYLASPLPAKFAKLFASILYCIDEQHYLITPVEKLRVSVAATPLVMVDYQLLAGSSDNNINFISSIGVEYSVINTDIEVNDDGIYLALGRGLTARLGRACYYRYINEFILLES